MPGEPDVAAAVEQFVRDSFGVAADDPMFGRDENLFDLGYVDSIGLAELLAYIESEFDVELSDDELVSDEFTTIDGIARTVFRRRSSSES
jgi:acyl carrier protein